MLISVDKRLAFLAMPKTGTTSIETALEPHCEIRFGRSPKTKHTTMRAFERFMLPYLKSLDAEDTEVFCVIREPVDWLGSWYRYRSRDGLKKAEKVTKAMSFATFVEAYLEKTPPAYAKIRSMSSFVIGRSGKPAVHHMFRYNNLDAVTAFLSGRFKGRLEMPRVNVSPAGETSLPPDLRARLETERPEDFELYADLAR